MNLKLPRKLLLMVALWAGTPTIAVFAHSVFLPDRVGAFVEREGPAVAGAGRGPHVYHAPTDLGTAHQIDVGAVMGLGTPEPRQWYGFGPSTGAPRPVLVLLHGAGRNGASMIDMWRDLATREGIILVAPDARGKNWSLITDGPMFLFDVLRDVSRHYVMDADRIYLAGHSDGGAHAMRIANLGGGPFKAVLTHSGHTQRYRTLPSLTPVPIHSFVGDADTVFTVDSSRAALQRLSKAGHPTSLTVIPNHTHWYYGIGKSLAPLMWARLTEQNVVPSVPISSPTESPRISQDDSDQHHTRTLGAKWIRVTPTN